MPFHHLFEKAFCLISILQKLQLRIYALNDTTIILQIFQETCVTIWQADSMRFINQHIFGNGWNCPARPRSGITPISRFDALLFITNVYLDRVGFGGASALGYRDRVIT